MRLRLLTVSFVAAIVAASAAPAAALADGAVVLHDDAFCGGGQRHAVITPSGQWMLTCNFPAGFSGGVEGPALIIADALCGFIDGPTRSTGLGVFTAGDQSQHVCVPGGGITHAGGN